MHWEINGFFFFSSAYAVTPPPKPRCGFFEYLPLLVLNHGGGRPLFSTIAPLGICLPPCPPFSICAVCILVFRSWQGKSPFNLFIGVVCTFSKITRVIFLDSNNPFLCTCILWQHQTDFPPRFSDLLKHSPVPNDPSYSPAALSFSLTRRFCSNKRVPPIFL